MLGNFIFGTEIQFGPGFLKNLKKVVLANFLQKRLFFKFLTHLGRDPRFE